MAKNEYMLAAVNSICLDGGKCCAAYALVFDAHSSASESGKNISAITVGEGSIASTVHLPKVEENNVKGDIGFHALQQAGGIVGAGIGQPVPG